MTIASDWAPGSNARPLRPGREKGLQAKIKAQWPLPPLPTVLGNLLAWDWVLDGDGVLWMVTQTLLTTKKPRVQSGAFLSTDKPHRLQWFPADTKVLWVEDGVRMPSLEIVRRWGSK